MLKKYLSSCSSSEQIQSKQTLTKINLTQRTIDYGTPKTQLNLGSIENSPSNMQYPTSEPNVSSKPSEQYLLKKDNSPAISGSPKQDFDLLITKRDETLKFRSASQNQKKLQLKRQSSEKQCSSNEKIRVFDVFNQSPRLNKQPPSSNTYITTKENLKVQLQQQKHNLQNQSKIATNNVNYQPQNNAQQRQSCKPPISSRLNESKEILQYMRKNSLNNKKHSHFKGEGETQKNQLFFHSPKYNESAAFSSSGKSQLQDAQTNLKYDKDNTKNENILELLLLSTQELNNKFKNKPLERNESEEKIPMKIRVRAGSRFPKDFFE
ncbi:unnamed protein product [Paramecium octaurelia]|uniref:Uncharacterized protein n=1 Tax=Paramecium octaurelia TaxID=43137 RepID=A0A8S1X0Y9_PAROT|nr:unnamed protein product [Paramecium octaurelia]